MIKKSTHPVDETIQSSSYLMDKYNLQIISRPKLVKTSSIWTQYLCHDWFPDTIEGFGSVKFKRFLFSNCYFNLITLFSFISLYLLCEFKIKIKVEVNMNQGQYQGISRNIKVKIKVNINVKEYQGQYQYKGVHVII